MESGGSAPIGTVSSHAGAVCRQVVRADPLTRQPSGTPRRPDHPPCGSWAHRVQPTGDMAKIHSVLVVDDEASVRSLYVDALETAGHHVRVAMDGQDALDRLRDGDVPCVVLSDVRMPRMDGWDLARAVARDPQLNSVRVVLLTGDRILSFTSPARDKPFSVVELDALVQRECQLHREPSPAGR